MNKILIIIVVMLLLVIPNSKAQDMPPDIEQALEENWRIITTKTIIWIGESLDIVVNGTPNATFSLELKMFNASSHTLYNSTYSEYARTGPNGTAYINIPDDFTEIPGEYRIMVVRNNIALTFIDIQVNYDPQRYDEIMRDKIWDYLGVDPYNLPDDTVWEYQRESIDYDKYEMEQLGKVLNFCYFLTALLIIIMLIQLPVWLQRYYDYKKLEGKGSLLLRVANRGKDRTLTYGGAIVGGKKPTIPDKGLTVDMSVYSLNGKNSDNVMGQIMDNAKKINAEIPKKATHEVKLSWYERMKIAKETKKKGGV